MKQRGTFDIITANLYSELLVTALPLWRANLRPGARLVLSGVMRTQERGVVRALRTNGYSTDETRRRGKWIALICS
jgi:ribosomal protein L11 methylase PrmA